LLLTFPVVDHQKCNFWDCNACRLFAIVASIPATVLAQNQVVAKWLQEQDRAEQTQTLPYEAQSINLHINQQPQVNHGEEVDQESQANQHTQQGSQGQQSHEQMSYTRQQEQASTSPQPEESASQYQPVCSTVHTSYHASITKCNRQTSKYKTTATNFNKCHQQHDPAISEY
jgi:hypothetical protein